MTVWAASGWWLCALLAVGRCPGARPSLLHNERAGSLPGVAMEYKIHVDAGKEDCYYQYVESNASLYVSFQVLRGGDGNAGLGIRNPFGQVVHPYAWKPEAEYEEHGCRPGYYQICIDNQFSKFSSKLVYVFITTFKFEDWEKYSAEIETLDVSIQNFTTTLANVEGRIQEMLRHQQTTRRHESRDYNALLGSRSYVAYWSLFLCVLILLCGSLQVFFVRKLFEIKSVRPGDGR